MVISNDLIIFENRLCEYLYNLKPSNITKHDRFIIKTIFENKLFTFTLLKDFQNFKFIDNIFEIEFKIINKLSKFYIMPEIFNKRVLISWFTDISLSYNTTISLRILFRNNKISREELERYTFLII